MPQPDASIGQYATAPVLEEIMEDAQKNPIPLDGATVRFIMSPRNRAVPPIEGHVEIQSPATDGRAQQIWKAGDTDIYGLWDYQWIVTLPGGEIVTVPADPRKKYRTLEIIKRLGAAAVSTPVRAPFATTIDPGADLAATLLAIDTTHFLPGQTFIRVRGLMGLFALDYAASNGGVASPAQGIYAADNATFLWVNS